MIKKLFLFAIILTTPIICNTADDVYHKPDKFISSAFAGTPPERKVFTVSSNTSKQINKIMQRRYPAKRFPYWQKERKTVWILEEIGKYKPITAGFVINGGKLQQVKVLIYRESHGWEVKHDFFTDQFKGVELEKDYELSERIDGISGATLSVDALIRMSKLALFLDEQVQ